jgi:hypothetical protein
MKLKFNSKFFGVLTRTMLMAGAFIFTVSAMQDPDVYVKEKLETLLSSITNATASELTASELDEMEKAVNTAEDFFKEPPYQPGLDLIGASTNPAENTLRKKIADRKTALATGTQTVTQSLTGAVDQPVGQAITGEGTQSLAGAVAQTVAKAPDINVTIVAHINNLLNGTSIKIGTKTYKTKTFKDKVAALKVLATTYKTTSGIASATQKSFATAIMTVGGTWIYKNYKNNNIDKHYAKRATKSNADKTKIKNFVKTAKKNIDNFGNYKSMLSVAYNSNLLGGTKTTGDKSFVYKILNPYINKLITLENVK